MNWANFLSYSRIFLAFVIFTLLHAESQQLFWAIPVLPLVLIYAVGCVTDGFDGYVARTFGCATRFGALLDPAADKFFIIAVMFAVAYFREPILWTTPFLFLLIIFREAMVGLAKGVEIKTTKLAKWKTGFQMVALGSVLSGEFLEILEMPFQFWGEILLLPATCLTLYTGADYAQQAYRQHKLEIVPSRHHVAGS